MPTVNCHLWHNVLADRIRASLSIRNLDGRYPEVGEYFRPVSRWYTKIQRHDFELRFGCERNQFVCGDQILQKWQVTAYASHQKGGIKQSERIGLRLPHPLSVLQIFCSSFLALVYCDYHLLNATRSGSTSQCHKICILSQKCTEQKARHVTRTHEKKVIVFNLNHFQMRLLNLRINLKKKLILRWKKK